MFRCMFFFIMLATPSLVDAINRAVPVAIASSSIAIVVTIVLILTLIALMVLRRKLGVETLHECMHELILTSQTSVVLGTCPAHSYIHSVIVCEYVLWLQCI